MTRTASSGQHELILVVALTALGALARFWSFGDLGLTHFDEGVYGLAGLWSLLPGGLWGLDPNVIPYAPPGFPILVGASYWLFGPADRSAILVALVCGVLTVPAAGWVARRTFGPGAGAAAAAFASVSIPHIAFSRKALTDAPFLLAWLIALGLGGRFLERPRLGRALALGLAVGLAQNLKYNGWLAGVVVAIAAVVGVLFHPEERRAGAPLRTFGLGLVAALVAAIVYAPWYQFVERHGGYGALLAHHRGYLGGPGVWLAHWNHQLAQVVALSGGIGWGGATWVLAVVAGMLALSSGEAPPRWNRWRLGIALAVGALLLSVLPNGPWWIGLAWCPWLIRDARPSARVAAVWWLMLSILTPFYHPYARLWLPLLAAGWVMMGGIFVLVRNLAAETSLAPEDATSQEPPKRVRLLVPAVLGLVCVVMAVTQEVTAGARAIPFDQLFQPTTDLRDALARLPRQAGLSRGERVHLLARRAVAFYLVLQGQHPVQLLSGLEQLHRDVPRDGLVLLDEAQLAQEGDRAKVEAKLFSGWPEGLHWDRVGRLTVGLDPVTRLDVDPGSAYDAPARHIVMLLLFKPRWERSRSEPPTPPPAKSP